MKYQNLAGSMLFALALWATPALSAEPEHPGSGTTLSSVIVYTQDIAGLSSFYEEALLLGEPAVRLDNHIGYWLDRNYLGFEIQEADAGRGAGATAWYGVEDIATAIERCIAAGARAGMAAEKQPWGDIHATVLDPDGNIMGLIEFGGEETAPSSNRDRP